MHDSESHSMLNTAEKPSADAKVAAEPTILRFDRRTHPRHRADGRVTAFRKDHAVPAYQHPVCSLRLADISEGGLGAFSDVPLEPDEQLAVCFPAHGAEPALELYGHVVRCRPRHDQQDEQRGDAGYELGVCFGVPPAA